VKTRISKERPKYDKQDQQGKAAFNERNPTKLKMLAACSWTVVVIASHRPSCSFLFLFYNQSKTAITVTA
jgi:hypothetical protein